MTRHLLITGPTGSGKTTIARAMANAQCATNVELDHAADGLPATVQVPLVILDELRTEVVVTHTNTLRAWMVEDVRLLYVSRDVARTPGEVLALMEEFGGFSHVQIGIANRPLAEVEIVPLNSAAATWAGIFDAMREDKRERSVDRVLSELSAAVSEAAIAPLERSALNAKIGLLASATRRPINNERS